MELLHIEILGFVAGATNLFSSVPQLLANLKNPQFACGQSASRNCLQCAANALWLGYGLSVGSISMAIFAALGCLMAGILVRQTVSFKTDNPWRETFRGLIWMAAKKYA